MNLRRLTQVIGLALAGGFAGDAPAAINGTVQPVTFTGPVTGQPSPLGVI